MPEVQCPRCQSGPFGRDMAYCLSCGEILPEGGLLHGRYRLLRLIGKGGAGSVYLANDVKLHQRQCAIKRIDVKTQNINLEQAEKEARVVVRAMDSGLVGIPDIYDTFSENRALFLVMRHIGGQPLNEWADTAPRPWQQIVQKALKAAEIVAQLHHLPLPIAHSDIKPQNILLDASENVWLVDFGLARADQEIDNADTSYIGGFTPGYAPWEQVKEERPSRAADVYALGMTLYRLLVGKERFENRKSARAVVYQPFAGITPQDFFAPEWDERLRQTLLDVTCAEPEKRPGLGQWMEALRKTLRPEHLVPLTLSNGAKLFTPQEFVDLAEVQREDALRLLQEGTFLAWLRREYYQDDLASQLEKAMRENSDPHQGLEAVLKILRPNLPAPQLKYALSGQPVHILRAQKYRLSLRLANSTRGYLPVEISAHPQWLTVSTPRVGLLGQAPTLVECVAHPHLIPAKRAAAEVELKTPQGSQLLLVETSFSSAQWFWMKFLRPFLDLARPLIVFVSVFLTALVTISYPLAFALAGDAPLNIRDFLQQIPQRAPQFFSHFLGFVAFTLLLPIGAEVGHWLGAFRIQRSKRIQAGWGIIMRLFLLRSIFGLFGGGIGTILWAALLAKPEVYSALVGGVAVLGSLLAARKTMSAHTLEQNVYEPPVRKSAGLVISLVLLGAIIAALLPSLPAEKAVTSGLIPAPHGAGWLYQGESLASDTYCYVETTDEVEAVEIPPTEENAMVKVRARCSDSWQEGWVQVEVLQPTGP